jgi:hypothetical protein
MRVERILVAGAQGGDQIRIEGRRRFAVVRWPLRQTLPRGAMSHEVGIKAQRFEDGIDRHARDYTGRMV